MTKSNHQKYKIIYADPPWAYSNWKGKRETKRTAESHYSVMTIDDIKSLPVGDIADKDSVCFMWVVSPELPKCIEILKAWGFEYKTVAFVWDKETKYGKNHFGMGYYTRPGAELCLLGKRGKGVPRINAGVRQVQRHKTGLHSQKPSEFRDLIIDLFGDVPRVELFARQLAEGWDSWGNEIVSSNVFENVNDVAL